MATCNQVVLEEARLLEYHAVVLGLLFAALLVTSNAWMSLTRSSFTSDLGACRRVCLAAKSTPFFGPALGPDHCIPGVS